MSVELGVLYSTNYRFFGGQNSSFEVQISFGRNKKQDNVTITWNQSLRYWCTWEHLDALHSVLKVL